MANNRSTWHGGQSTGRFQVASVKLPFEIKMELEALAAARGLSISDLLRDLVYRELGGGLR